MKALGIALLLLSLALTASAQGGIPERLLLTTGHYIGPGARALGLGGTYTGVADDYAAVWWNPAGLVQVKRIELQGSLDRVAYGAESKYWGGTRDGSTSGMRLNNAGIVLPVPVYQGALSFAAGYSHVQAFERRTRVRALDTASPYAEYDELEGGRLSFWTFAGALDVSPNLALGMGINYWMGVDDYTWTGWERQVAGQLYSEQTISTDLSALGANLGILARLGSMARFGFMFQSPMAMSLKEEFSDTRDTSRGYWNYRMTYPAVFRSGFSIAQRRWLFAFDAEYRDWTTLEYRSEPPLIDEFGRPVSRAAANQEIKDWYRSTVRLSAGLEYLLPAYGVRVRGGYSYEPSNFKPDPDSADRHALSLGFGVLVDRSVMFDAGLRLAAFKEKSSSRFAKNIATNAAVVSISYRI